MPRPVSNPPNPWESTAVEWLEPPPPARLEVYEERAREILATNESPDIPFRWSLNPYRGCQHGCAYCYARPTHQYLSFGAGTDFERRIVVKTNAPELLRRKLASHSWRREPIHFSGVTDPYQPLEACYELTRRSLEACLAGRNPVVVVTKAALVLRDADLLAALARGPGAQVILSIPFAAADVARRLEPGVASPARRFLTMRALAARGIPVGLSLSPLIPGLNESDVPALLRRAAEAGAKAAFCALVHLPGEALAVFQERLKEAFPARAAHVLAAIRDVRGGALSDDRFHARMRGRGPRWDATMRLFAVHCRRLGLATGEDLEPLRPPDPPPPPIQRTLFGE
ncbi:MAG: radical SAM protein [Planctomycetota bacterium]